MLLQKRSPGGGGGGGGISSEAKGRASSARVELNKPATPCKRALQNDCVTDQGRLIVRSLGLNKPRLIFLM